MLHDPKRPRPVSTPTAADYDRVTADEDGASPYYDVK